MTTRFSPAHRDAADRPAASHRPEMADLVDRLEEVLLDLVCEQGVTMTPGMERVVTAIACGLRRGSPHAQRLQEAFGVGPVVRGDLEELARELMARIDGDSNPQLEAACVDFTLGLGLNGGKTQTEIGAEFGVGRACVSARCISIREDFDRPPARGMKSDAARGAYRARELAKPRRVKETWAFAGMLGGIFGVSTKGVAHA